MLRNAPKISNCNLLNDSQILGMLILMGKTRRGKSEKYTGRPKTLSQIPKDILEDYAGKFFIVR